MPGGPKSSTPFGILAPSAWYFAGFCRKSLISCSSSTASSAPATSAKVVFGVSLVISFALDLPKLSTRRAAALHLRHEQQQQDHQHRDRQQVDQQAQQDAVLGDLGVVAGR